jgi:endonuclease YncB( thermonuclease family)
MTHELYTYSATVLEVIDGDTLKLRVDLGFKIFWVSNCRLADINAMELKDKDQAVRARAFEAKKYMEDRLPVNSSVLIKSSKLDKYGRPVVTVYYGDRYMKNMNNELLTAQLVEVYR